MTLRHLPFTLSLLLATTAQANTLPPDALRANAAMQGGGSGTMLLDPAFTSGLSGAATGTPRLQATPAMQRELAKPERERLPPQLPVDSPLPPDAFAQLATSVTQQPLRVFGRELFERDRPRELPGDLPLAADAVLKAGDRVQLRIWGQLDSDLELVVDSGGMLFVPKVGAVRVNGLRRDQAEAALRGAVARVYRNFDLSLGSTRVSSLSVTVVGHARRPGVQEVSSNASVLSALLLAGGPDATGSLRHVVLKRAGQDRLIDLYDLLLKGGREADVRLQPGDVVLIPPMGTRVAVAGGVVRPAIYELLPSETLADAVRYAGGLRADADNRRLVLDRQRYREGRMGMEISGRDLSVVVVANQDILQIPVVGPAYDQSVSLRGHVRTPRRLAWREGLRVSDLIDSLDQLRTPDFWAARERVGEPLAPTRESRLKSLGALQGLTAQEPGVMMPNSGFAPAIEGQYAMSGRVPGGLSLPRQPVADDAGLNDPLKRMNELDTVNWEYATIERLDPVTQGVSLVTFNLRRALINKLPSDDLALQAGDIVTLYSTQDIRVPKQVRPRYVRITGEVAAPGIYRVDAQETLADLIARIGGLTPDAYLFGTRIVREEVRERQRAALKRYIERQEQVIEQAGAVMSASLLNAADSAQIRAQLEGQRNALAKLRNSEPDGRVKMALPARRQLALDDLPVVTLEHGDVVEVPSLLTTVGVTGEVNNPGDFLAEEASLGTYLKRAGGGNTLSDLSASFVMRADGTVLARKQKAWLFGLINTFAWQDAMPGDTLVVPPILDARPLLRDLRDVSQVLANFGLGAAAINNLKN